MSSPSPSQFGLILAYLIPGFVGLAGAAPLFPIISQWLKPVPDGVLGFGPTVYTLLAALTTSQIINCFRWLILDHIHSWTGIRAQSSNFGDLRNGVEGFDYLVQNHYRYYQFAGNMLLAVTWSYGVNRYLKTLPSLGPGTDLGMAILVVVLFAASRDALWKYYHRTHALLGGFAEKANYTMYNGIGHHDGGGSDKKQAETKPDPKLETSNTPKPEKNPPSTPKPK